MAIVEDTSTPAAVSQTGWTTATVVTASFSPPANSLLVAMVDIGYKTAWTTAPTLSVAPSAGGFTFSQALFVQETTHKFNVAGIYLGQVGSAPGAITVTATRTNTLTTSGVAFAVRVLTGAATAASQPGVTSSNDNAGTSGIFEVTMTPTQLNSQVYVQAGLDIGATAGAADAQTTTIVNNSDSTDGTLLSIGRGTNLTSSLTSTTYGWASSSAVSSVTQGIEILPAAVVTLQPTRHNPARFRASLW